MSKKVSLVSLGCAKNLVDSEKMLGLLAEDGLTPTADELAFMRGLFRSEPYAKSCAATVTAVEPRGVVLDRTALAALGVSAAPDEKVLELLAPSKQSRTFCTS